MSIGFCMGGLLGNKCKCGFYEEKVWMMIVWRDFLVWGWIGDLEVFEIIGEQGLKDELF